MKSKKFTKESNPVSYRLAEKSDQLKKSGDKAAEEGRHVAAAGNYAGSAATFAGSLPALAVEEISRPAYEAYKDWRGEPYGYADGGFVQPHNFINAVGYADGGMVGLQPAAPTNFMNAVGYQNGGGVGMPPNGGNSYASDPSMVDAHINDGFAKNPQVREQIKQIVMEAVQSGELTPQELNQIIQLAKAAQHNPGIWPQLRNFMIQQGADPSEIPEQYDQGLVSIVLIIAKAVEQDLSQGAGGMPQPGMQPPMQMKADGGLIVGPGTGTSDSIPAVNSSDGSPVAVSNGEYVIPASVVQAKGVDFFDGLVRKYHTPNGLKK